MLSIFSSDNSGLRTGLRFTYIFQNFAYDETCFDRCFTYGGLTSDEAKGYKYPFAFHLEEKQ